MSKLVLNGDTSGSVTLDAPAVSGTTTLTLPTTSGTVLTTGSTFGGTGPAFSAYANTSTSISAGTRTKVTFATEYFDTNNNFASSRFTPTVAGYYQISLSFQESNGTNTILQAELYKNGTVYAVGGYIGTSGAYYIAGVSVLVYMNGTTDYLEGYCYSSASTSVGNGANSNWFCGSLVRSA